MRRTLGGRTASRSAKILVQLTDLRSTKVFSSRLRSRMLALTGWRRVASRRACSVEMAVSSWLRRTTRARVSPIRVRPTTIRESRTANTIASASAPKAVAKSSGRSLRKGSLARLMGILTLVARSFEVTQQTGVEGSGHAQVAAQHFSFEAQIRESSGGESAQRESFGGRG